jgi:DivIVA domain-containing protein
MEWFVAVVAVAALGVAAIVAAGGMGEMPRDPVRDTYRQDLPADRQLTAADLERLRFGITLRGYAMDQVDDVLDRLGHELADRDRVIAELGRERMPPPAPRTGSTTAAAPLAGHPAATPELAVPATEDRAG